MGDESGVALILALLSMLMLTALGMALAMTTTTERRISSNYRDGVETIYAADAAVERVMQDVLTVPDWNRILDGSTTSSFVDGAPGLRTLPDGSKLNLLEATAMVRCGKTACSNAEIEVATDERPWAKNNPRWQLYAYGPLTEVIPTATVNSNIYVIVWIGDDPSENDDLPLARRRRVGWRESGTRCGVDAHLRLRAGRRPPRDRDNARTHRHHRDGARVHRTARSGRTEPPRAQGRRADTGQRTHPNGDDVLGR